MIFRKKKYPRTINELEANWNSTIDVNRAILNSGSISSGKSIYNSSEKSPMSLYGLLDLALVERDKKEAIHCMNEVCNYIHTPFPNPLFVYKTNDPIGQVMLKPLIIFPIQVSTDEKNMLLYRNWMLVGYAYLFKAVRDEKTKAFDSLRTIGSSIEANSDHFAFIVFQQYLGIANYVEAYIKFLVFLFALSSDGYKNYTNHQREAEHLMSEARRYYNELDSNTEYSFSEVRDHGIRIAMDLYKKIVEDIHHKRISFKDLLPPVI